jgi:hypothetical protein
MQDMKKVTSTFDTVEYSALARLANLERREPRDQVAFIVRRELVKRGLLSLSDISRSREQQGARA